MSLRKIIREYLFEQHWTIGFIQEPLANILSGESYIINYVQGMPKDRWFADPFILDYNDETIQILVEEFCYKIRRGRIAKLNIDRCSLKLLDYKIILDLSSHLSFPFIQRKGDRIFISPENSESGEWTMYEYNHKTDELTKVKSVINQPLTDAIITDSFGKEQIFSTQTPNQNGNKLTVYSIEGKKEKEILFSSNVARNAGDWFKLDETVYRPAQDCNGAYGTAVILQEVTTKGDDYHFKDVRRIESTNPMFTTGCHTFNSYKGLTVIDVHGYRRPSLFKVVKIIRKLKNRI